MAAQQINGSKNPRDISDLTKDHNLRREIDIRDKEVEALQQDLEHHLFLQKIVTVLAVGSLALGTLSAIIGLYNMVTINAL